jgi:hypothetical protein
LLPNSQSENIEMIKIELIDPNVLAALEVAYPKPANSAYKALNKYIRVLETMLDEEELREKDNYNILHNFHTLSTSNLTKSTPQLGPKKMRIHKWLEDNHYNLIEIVEKGSPFGEYAGNSKVKITKRITITHIDDWEDPAAAFHRLHPNFDKLSPQQIQTDYDVCEVDLDSLNNYINQLAPHRQSPKNNSDKTAYRQAIRIAAAATYKNGLFYQKKNPSKFGRTYYSGLSVQSVSKKTRAAMLGDCYEYDIVSGVVAWKLSYAQTHIAKHNLAETVQEIFPLLDAYVTDKTSLIYPICEEVFKFPISNELKKTAKEKHALTLIKKAMTAVNFGAKLTLGHFDKAGNLVKHAMGKTFENEDEHTLFKNDVMVNQFIREKELLDESILKTELLRDPSLSNNGFLLNKKGKLKSQVTMAYLYQHAETQVMDIFRSYAKTHNLTILANIHDAIIFKDPLPHTLKDQILDAMRVQTKNPYWNLKEEMYHRIEDI